MTSLTAQTLREELRKVQSSVLMAEKSRNPGVGCALPFPCGSDGADFSQHSAQGTAGTPNGSTVGRDTDSVVSDASTPANEPNGAASSSEQALNFEYIRSVVLQFVEKPQMRVRPSIETKLTRQPHLVGVLSVILHFTPAETRRLTAKASA